MPASGKSTVGVLLAKALKCQFVDSDLEIQKRESALLREILTSQGFLELRAIEEKVLLNIPLKNSVLATGGSAIYSAKAMKRLKAETDVVYLKTPLELITTLKPDYIVKGDEYRKQVVVGADIVKARGGKVVLVPTLDGHSTSKLVSS